MMYDPLSRHHSVVVVSSLIFVVVQLSSVVGFYLQGSRTSYVRLPRWYSCYNSSLTLEFWTSLSDALLVYADDGGRSSFLVLAIDDGAVVARISVAADDLAAAGGDRASTTLRVVSRPVNDRHWHKVGLDNNNNSLINPNNFCLHNRPEKCPNSVLYIRIKISWVSFNIHSDDVCKTRNTLDCFQNVIVVATCDC